jgi:hypothetical protein
MQEHLSMQPASHVSAHPFGAEREAQPHFEFELNVIKWFRLVSHRKPCLFRRCLRSAFMVDLAEI